MWTPHYREIFSYASKTQVFRETPEITKQSIYLFYEQNDEDERKIDSKLVRLYMNRFIVEENDQNEIIGVKYFKKIEKTNYHRNLQFSREFINLPQEFRSNFAYPIFNQWKKSKELKFEHDLITVNAALRKSKQMEELDNTLHFIIGSSYYMRLYTENWFSDKEPLVHFDLDEFVRPRPFPIENLILNVIEEFSHLKFRCSFACTFICGLYFSICKKSEFQQSYDTLHKTKNPAILSVNNDLEAFYDSMMTEVHAKKTENQYTELFQFNLVPDYEEINFLETLKYNDSRSVGFNPIIMQESKDFQVHSLTLDHCNQESGSLKHFFPPMRNPMRNHLKSIISLSIMSNIKASIEIRYGLL